MKYIQQKIRALYFYLGKYGIDKNDRWLNELPKNTFEDKMCLSYPSSKALVCLSDSIFVCFLTRSC